MSTRRIGLWLVGAWGNVGTTVAVGLAALQKKLIPTTGLVTELPMFAKAGLPEFTEFIVGGHEVRPNTYYNAAQALWQNSRMFSPDLLDQVEDVLENFDTNVRPGTLVNVGNAINSIARKSGSSQDSTTAESPLAAIERLTADLVGFKDTLKLDHVIVVNLASTEPASSIPPNDPVLATWKALEEALNSEKPLDLPASSLYAIAAFNSGCTYINFTPSVGSNLPALAELADLRKALHGGRDGKTGETLLKSVLAPMFRARNLEVKSWVGHNILGNADGQILNDPNNKATKVNSKDRLLGEILGYKPQSLVSIEYIESLGDWKTAWDHVHFDGFLGTRMTMQVTWQGCDSALAAPLVIDLARLADREKRAGGSGVMSFLSSFFKSPMGTELAEFAAQNLVLADWAKKMSKS